MSPSERRHFFTGLGFISPWVIGFSVFLLLPIALSFYLSLTDWSLSQARAPMYVGLANYRDLLGDEVFIKVLRNTLVYAAIALPAGLCVSLGIALLLNTQVPGQPLFRTIIFLPSLVPIVASSMLWLWLFNARIGLINTVLNRFTPVIVQGLFVIVPCIVMLWLALSFSTRINRGSAFRAPVLAAIAACVLWTVFSVAGIAVAGWFSTWRIEGPGWLIQPHWALPALAFMALWGVGHTVVIFLAGLQDVPRELYESAEIDGASPIRRLWHVTLPTISPVIFFNLIMAIIGTFQVFTVPYIMTQGGPDRATYFFSMYLFDNAFNFPGRMGYASAMAWIQLLIILSLTAVAFWTSKKWVHYQGK